MKPFNVSILSLKMKICHNMLQITTALWRKYVTIHQKKVTTMINNFSLLNLTQVDGTFNKSLNESLQPHYQSPKTENLFLFFLYFFFPFMFL